MNSNWGSLTQEQYIAKFKEYIKQINMQERNLKLSLESATELYKTATNEMKTILENTFPELVKSEYPMSHNELQEMLDKETIYYINSDSEIEKIYSFNKTDFSESRNIILSEQRAKELLAFTQLIALRDKWNEIDEFKPNWKDEKLKYCIRNSANQVIVDDWCERHFSLAFKTKETRDLFLETFKELIEEAKNLI